MRGRWEGTPTHARAALGAVLYHGLSDRDTAAAQIDTQLVAIVSAVLRAAGADAGVIRWNHKPAIDDLAAWQQEIDVLEKRVKLAPWDWMAVQSLASLKSKKPTGISDFQERALKSREALERSPYLSLWDDAVSPTFDEWNAFYNHRNDWYDAASAITTSWEEYLAWARRVQDLRATVEHAGVPIAAPPMQGFPTSVQEHAEDLAKDVKAGVGDVLSMAKVLIYGGLALGGVVVLTSLSSHARNKSDPIESWARLRRGG